MKKAKSIKSNNNPKNHSPILDQISRQRLWFYRFFTMILVPVILFFLLEISLRLFHFGYPTSALIETNINGRNYIRENSAFAYRFFPKRLAREFTPLRFEADKPKDVFRIFILGGSAAQGTPDAAFSFGRILEVMLQLKYPDTKFEILPMAMPAINSHVVVEIAKDCAAYKPDLLIVYMGNNEVVGPFGPGTILTPIASNISLLRFGIRLKSTKIYQLITLTLEKMNILKSPFNQWKGMEMFLENQVRINDPGLEITYNHFNDNLEKLNQIGYENNIKIIYSTVVSNLKDCPPFNSLHRADISEAELQNWERFYSSGSAHEKAGQCRQAIKDYLKAAKVDSEYADLQYRLGHCYWESGNFTQARKHYFNAREYDTNRFRADNRINTIIRNSAVSLDGFAFLADALSEIQQKCPGGLPGNDFLLEHVHLNFEGNYQVAHTIFKQIEQIIPDRLKNIKTNNSINISDSLCAGYLAYNYYEKHHILELVLNGFIKQPPFTNQLYHLETIESLETELDKIRQVIQSLDSNHLGNTYKEAIKKRPSDWLLRYKYAGYLADANVRKYQESAKQYELVIEAVPHDPNTYVMRGVVLAKLGQFNEALIHNQQALDINPAIAKAHFNSGLIYQKLQKTKSAQDSYGLALFYDPAHSKAANNLAFIYSQSGDISKAIATINRGLKNNPNDLLLNYNLAMFLYRNDNKAEAIEQLRHTVRLAPDEAMIRKTLDEWLKENK